jgi:hypothetical protein
VQREHQVRSELFPQRVGADERRDLDDELLMPPERQFVTEALLGDQQAALLQQGCRGGDGFPADTVKRRSAPVAERGA